MTMEGDANFPPAALGCLWEAAGAREAEIEVVSKLTMVFSPASDYFSAYLGEYRNVLSALEALNSAVLAAMDKTKLVRMGLWEGGGAGGCIKEAAVILAACLAFNLGVRGSKCTSQISGVACACFSCLHVQFVLQKHSLQHDWRRGSCARGGEG